METGVWDCLIWLLQGDSKLRGQLEVTQMKGGRVVWKGHEGSSRTSRMRRQFRLVLLGLEFYVVGGPRV